MISSVWLVTSPSSLTGRRYQCVAVYLDGQVLLWVYSQVCLNMKTGYYVDHS